MQDKHNRIVDAVREGKPAAHTGHAYHELVNGVVQKFKRYRERATSPASGSPDPKRFGVLSFGSEQPTAEEVIRRTKEISKSS